MRVLIASIVLLAVNAAALVPDLQDFRTWAPAVSIVIALYLLIQAALLMKSRGDRAAAAETPSPAPAEPDPQEREREINAHVLHFLGRLQEKGRLVDFVMDDITSYDNEQVGAAARVVHQGCSQVIKEHLSIAPVHSAEEGATVTLESGYDSARFRAIGTLAGSPPFHGTLLHRGWKATQVDLPRLAEKPSPSGDLVIAPAEVEVK